MTSVAAVVREFVDTAVGTVRQRVDEAVAMAATLDRRVAELPAPKDGQPGASAFQVACAGGFRGSEAEWLDSLRGKDGAAGPDGKVGEPGERGDDGKDGDRGLPGLDGAGGINGKDGAPGERGTMGVDGSPGREGERGADGAVGKDGADGNPGVDGAPGEKGADGAPGAAGKDGERGSDGPPGKDGPPGIAGRDGAPGKDADPVHPDTLALMVAREVAGAVEKAAGAIPRAKDGEPGRDALDIEPLPAIDEAKSYPRGTYAGYRGGMIRSLRQTDPLAGSDLARAGWVVMLNGIESETETTEDDGRTDRRVTRYTDGTELVRTIDRAVVIDKGVWSPAGGANGVYQKGDGVTFGGSFWIAQRATLPAEKPGESDPWRLSVKRGRDGADAKAKN